VLLELLLLRLLLLRLAHLIRVLPLTTLSRRILASRWLAVITQLMQLSVVIRIVSVVRLLGILLMGRAGLRIARLTIICRRSRQTRVDRVS
jgi:hypothetical protein